LEAGILANEGHAYNKLYNQSSIVVRMNNVCVLSKLFSHHYQLVRKLFVIHTPLKDYVEQ